MAEREDNNPIRSILETRLDVLSSVSSSSQSFIFWAPRELRQVNAGAFEPQIISIGPYHHGRHHLKAMEAHKDRYFSYLLRRRKDRLDRYIDFSKSIEEEARNCYAETVTMSSEDFIVMMILDGLFVVELISKFTDKELREQNDSLFKQNLNLTILAQDLLLLENQLPFFVLKRLAVMTGLKEVTFTEKALRFFSGMVPGPRMPYADGRPVVQNDKHLLGVVHDNWLSSPVKPYNQLNLLEKIRCRVRGIQSRSILSAGAGAEAKAKAEELKRRELRVDFIRSATELIEVGIRFKKGGENSLFDIKFGKGQMHIPTLIVNHKTERIFRNLLAYEQFNHGVSIVMDYARLMDCLINSAADVALLSDCGIIDNWLGSNEQVANMFNKLNDYVYLSTANFHYFDIFQKVNKYRRSNLWKVKLRQKYFHSPWNWVLTSIVAATILLLLTLVQTIFSVIAYFK